MRTNKAFTLIELLVVIAIIALLVSILLPSLNRARELARAAVCSVHMKYIGTGFTIYGNENDDFFPVVHGDDYNSPLAPPQEWWEYLIPCGFQRENLVCPSDPHKDEERDDPFNAGEKRKIDSYIINGMFVFSKQATALKQPGKHVVVSERVDEGPALTHQGYPAWKARTVWEGMIKKDRHGEKSNYLLSDMSIQAMAWEETIGDCSDEEDMHFVQDFNPPAR